MTIANAAPSADEGPAAGTYQPAEADRRDTEVVEVTHQLGELEAFHGAARGVVLGVEIDHIRFTVEARTVCHGHIGIGQDKPRGRVSNVQHGILRAGL